MTKKLRVFYRKSDSQIVWTSSLEGGGVFPRTIQEELKDLPEVKLGATMEFEGVPLGGKPEDYSCVEINDSRVIFAFMASDNNSILRGKLVTGMLRPIVEPLPPRDLAKEIDELRTELAKLKGR